MHALGEFKTVFSFGFGGPVKPLLWVGLTFFMAGCAAKSMHPEPGEGENEYDPGPVTPGEVDPEDEPDPDPDPEPDPDPDPEDDTGEPEDDPTPSELTVCYPGLSEDYTTCFPLIDAGPDLGADYAYPEPYMGNPQYNPPTRYIDLRVVDTTQALAPNFIMNEFMSVTKGPFGLYQVHAVESLQAVREASGGPIYVNSGYRNVAYNESVGGAEHSRHMYGDAIDMSSEVLSLGDLAEVCEDFGAGFTKIYESHVHCDWRNDPLDDVFFE